MRLLGVVLVVGLCATAHGAPVVLRMASPAPEGTAWAREARALDREIQALTHGEVRIKYYLGSITGDELETAERIRRGQLDGIASGGTLCNRLAPSMRVLRVMGLFQSRDESAYVSGRLKGVFDEEFAKKGFVNLGELGVGPDIVFSRTPVRTMAELRQTKLWVWDLDEMYRLQMQAMGLKAIPTPIEQAGRAYDEGQLDGFIAVPTAALAFQWSSRVKHFNDLHVGFLRGCFILSSRAYDQLSVQQQEALKEAHARLLARLENIGRELDQQLINGLFEKQGTKRVDGGTAFRAEFFEAARAMREKLGDKLVSPVLLAKVLSMLADYRAEHAVNPSTH
jgi:TRAP-type C4-dicarboxylate transport system substrate-binding protein